ncbi:phage holin [Bacillus sp. EB600]|uniref:phage holin n=1 Tax=Bacillus sp. EB600 TaxID=2806345 RepID=UPI00210F0140|nr:phage holin [Bacillus sp. EB600]MCQ6279218.1 phage holin [Bacillus sp. EB600]
MVNWKVRFKNRSWVVSFISHILIIAQIVISGLNSLGIIHFQLTNTVVNDIITCANAIFIVLSLLGFVQDPTTKGFADSEHALKYEKPK